MLKILLLPLHRARDQMRKRYMLEKIDQLEDPLHEIEWVGKLPFLQRVAYDIWGPEAGIDE